MKLSVQRERIQTPDFSDLSAIPSVADIHIALSTILNSMPPAIREQYLIPNLDAKTDMERKGFGNRIMNLVNELNALADMGGTLSTAKSQGFLDPLLKVGLLVEPAKTPGKGKTPGGAKKATTGTTTPPPASSGAPAPGLVPGKPAISTLADLTAAYKEVEVTLGPGLKAQFELEPAPDPAKLPQQIALFEAFRNGLKLVVDGGGKINNFASAHLEKLLAAGFLREPGTPPAGGATPGAAGLAAFLASKGAPAPGTTGTPGGSPAGTTGDVIAGSDPAIPSLDRYPLWPEFMDTFTVAEYQDGLIIPAEVLDAIKSIRAKHAAGKGMSSVNKEIATLQKHRYLLDKDEPDLPFQSIPYIDNAEIESYVQRALRDCP
jgi:hypothetical protein